ncbi:MAG: cysteine desulfurase family protein [Candidatus Hadarchaeales archaeon]
MKAYLDCGSTTPVSKEVLEAMLPYLTEKFGHPLFLYSLGQEAADAIEKSREKIARTISAGKEEIIFTSGATESNDLALRGVAYANRKRGNHIITTKIENPGVLRICERLEKEGFKVDYLSVDREGFVNLEELKRRLTDKTILVSIGNVNDEIGTIQPMEEIKEILEGRDVYLHVNAAAGYGRVKIDVEEIGADLLSLSAHKIHGPKGVGALYLRKGTEIEPLGSGYVSLSPLRPGTENVAGIVGFAKAAEIASEKLEEHRAYMVKLRERLMSGIEESIPHVVLHGPRGEKRSPSNVNYSFKGIEGESILLRLDLHGIAVATGSACATRKLEPSHVLTAIGIKPEVAHGSIRFTFTWMTKMEEIEYTLGVLPGVIEGLRRISPIKPEEM